MQAEGLFLWFNTEVDILCVRQPLGHSMEQMEKGIIALEMVRMQSFEYESLVVTRILSHVPFATKSCYICKKRLRKTLIFIVFC